MAVQLPPQSVYASMTSTVKASMDSGKPLQISGKLLDDLGKVADLHKEDPNAPPGEVFKFKDTNGVEHSLSVKDFDVAGGIFKGMGLQKSSDSKATLVVGDNMGEVLASLPKGPGEAPTSASGDVGKAAKAPDTAAEGEVGYRLIRVTDGDPIKVYGKVCPKAEALIADGWLSDNDMHALHAGNKAWEYSGSTGDVGKNQATKTMSLLYQRQIDGKGTVYGGGFSTQEKNDQKDTFQSMKSGNKYIDNTFVSGHEGQGAKGKFEVMSIDFDKKLPVVTKPPVKGPKADPPTVQLSNARIVLGKIDAAPNVAPEDKAFLKQTVFLKFIAQFPDDSNPGRAGALSTLPSGAEVDDALKEMGFDPKKHGLDPKKPVLEQMLNHPEKFTLQLQALADKLGIPTSL